MYVAGIQSGEIKFFEFYKTLINMLFMDVLRKCLILFRVFFIRIICFS